MHLLISSTGFAASTITNKENQLHQTVQVLRQVKFVKKSRTVLVLLQTSANAVGRACAVFDLTRLFARRLSNLLHRSFALATLANNY